ncbi:MAG: hypothetical protein Q7U41_01750 [Microbacterium sp.]|nr:hypothetical protein [Microbacterium sp.]
MIEVPRRRWLLLGSLFAAYFVVIAVTTFAQTDRPWAFVTAAAIYVAVALVLLVPALRGPVGAPTAIVTALATVAIALLCISALDPRALSGYSTWFIGANGVLLTILLARGQRLIAWIGVALQAAITAFWYASPAVITSGIVGTIIWVTVADLLTSGVRRVARNVREMGDAELAAARLQAAQDAQRRERRSRLDQTARVATPLLREIIANDGVLSEHVRRRILVVEAGIRDEIRGGSLLNDAVRREVTSARWRGASVSLLDEGGLDDIKDRTEILDTLAAAIAAFDGDRLIVRTGPGTDAAVTVVGLAGSSPGLVDDDEDADMRLWLRIPRPESAHRSDAESPPPDSSDAHGRDAPEQ